MKVRRRRNIASPVTSLSFKTLWSDFKSKAFISYILKMNIISFQLDGLNSSVKTYEERIAVCVSSMLAVDNCIYQLQTEINANNDLQVRQSIRPTSLLTFLSLNLYTRSNLIKILQLSARRSVNNWHIFLFRHFINFCSHWTSLIRLQVFLI